MKHLFDPTTRSLIVWRASRRISILFFVVCALFSLLACVSPELASQQPNVKSDLTHTPTVGSENSNSDASASASTPTAPPAPTLTASAVEPTVRGNPLVAIRRVDDLLCALKLQDAAAVSVKSP